MKAGITTSMTLHAVLLGVGVLTLSSPKAFEVADMETFPVEIVPIESISQVQQGVKTAPKAERSIPIPTARPDIVPEAQNVGNADADMDTPPVEKPKPRPVEQATEPAPAPDPTPAPVEKPKPQEAVKEPEPAPQPPKQAQPEVQPEKPVTERVAEESTQLPDTAPIPQARPERPQPEKIAEQKKPAEKPVEKAETKPAEKRTPQRDTPKKDAVLDEVAALLNKEQASGGGAKRSTDQASLGGRRSTGGEKLSQSEMDALRGQVQRCWNVPAGALDAQDIKVSVKFRLNPSGEVEGVPEIISNSGNSTIHNAAANSARRAIIQCAPYNLPAEKYETWADVIVNFDPSDMF